MESLLKEIRQCRICAAHLPLGPRPVLSASLNSKIVVIGQAPGIAVHNSGIPWDDPSGRNLRNWMGIPPEVFYDKEKIAIIPMGFCYPGKGKTGDLPPRKECAENWHNPLMSKLKNVELTLLIGKYAQNHYLQHPKKNLTETVRCFDEYLPDFFVLPHPSPRNNIWQAKNRWFPDHVLPELKNRVRALI